MSAITTHILDTSRGRPASGVEVVLDFFSDEAVWREVGRSVSNVDGRVTDLIAFKRELLPGTYRLTFAVSEYFTAQGIATFYPSVSVSFFVGDTAQHYHVPLLLNPFGYSTYRGS